jgi:hypothetical protein
MIPDQFTSAGNSTSSRPAMCGKWVSMWYQDTNQTVNATIQDYCEKFVLPSYS